MTGLYLGALHFDGDPDALLLGYQRLLEHFPLETLALHICVRQDGGLTVFDACPSKQIFTEFTAGDAFRGAVAGAGLPAPRVEPLGDIHVAHLLKEAGR
jgi:hypothetical protein